LRQRVQVRLDRLPRRPQVHRAGSPLAAREHVEADVRRDPVEPRAEARAPLEAAVALPGADEGVLDRVLGLERRAEHAVAVARQLGPVMLELPTELAFAVPDPERRLLHPPHPNVTSAPTRR